MSATLRTASLLLASILFGHTCFSQVEFKNPFYTHRENSTVSIEKVLVKPGSIIFQLEYEGGGAWKLVKNTGFYNFRGRPYLHIMGGGSFSLSDGTIPDGVPAARYDHYSGPVRSTSPPKKKALVVEFPFNATRMFFNMFNERYTKSDNALYMNFSECSVKNPVKDWSPTCINFKNIMLPFTHKQLHILYFGNYLSDTYTKGEFETTEAFQKRNHPDSLFKELSYKFKVLEEVFQDQFRSRVSALKPVLKYNADRQQFMISYPGITIDPIVIAVPLAEAEKFKNDVQDGNLRLDNWKFIRKSEDQFYVSQLDVSDKKSYRKTYENLAAKKYNDEGEKQFRKSVFNEAEKILLKGKSWNYID